MRSSKEFASLTGPLGPRLQVEGRTHLYFGGTAYLGMPSNSAFKELYLEGISRYGINNGTSRNSNVQLGIYAEAEQCAAERFGAEAAIIVSSGYLAAQLCIGQFVHFGQLEYAPGSHPALWLPDAFVPEERFNHWAQNLMKKIQESPEKQWVIVANSMNNLVPEVYDFSFLEAIPKDKEILLLIDDSHGIGILHHGLGVYGGLTSKNIQVIVTASMAKALGVDAGLILGSADLIDKLKGSNEFAGASPPAAAGLYAFMHAGDIYEAEFEKLRSLQAYFSRNKRISDRFDFVEGFPVFLSRRSQLFEELLDKHILISSFPYPRPSSPALSRLVICSWHTEADLNELLQALPD
jgi:8-amino-7-oxononanoate synthase